MSGAPEANMWLRCFSCGYDIASLVAHPSRASEFVCPECGVSLNESLAAPPGLAVQRTWSTRDYLRFLPGAFLHPLRTADGINPDLSDGASLAFLNCVTASLFSGVLAFVVGAVSAALSGQLSEVLWAVVVAFEVTVSLAIGLVILACALGYAVTVVAEILGASRSKARAFAAMDIATVWFFPLLPVALAVRWAPVYLPWLSVPRWGMLAASLTPLIVAFSIGVAVHLRWKAARRA